MGFFWIQLFVGDLLRVKADAICTSTNPWLSLQAGTGGSVRLFGGHDIQEACDALLAAEENQTGRRYFATGTAHLTHSGGLGFKGVLHCVAIDAFHGSSEDVIASCVRTALTLADRERFEHVGMPVFATGNGRFDFARALGAMRGALAESDAQAVDRVTIAVPDMSRADEARRILSQRGTLIVSSERDEQLTRWVGPIYQELLHGNHLSLDGAERDEFLADARRAVAEADEPGLRRLLWDSNWRPRLVAAWLAGIIRETRLESLIAELLAESELPFAGQGYCFALARFGTPSSAEALERYLERWLPRADCQYEQDWALAALERIDRERAVAWSESWARFATASRVGAATLDAARERLKSAVEFVDEHLPAS